MSSKDKLRRLIRECLCELEPQNEIKINNPESNISIMVKSPYKTVIVLYDISGGEEKWAGIKENLSEESLNALKGLEMKDISLLIYESEENLLETNGLFDWVEDKAEARKIITNPDAPWHNFLTVF